MYVKYGPKIYKTTIFILTFLIAFTLFTAFKAIDQTLPISNVVMKLANDVKDVPVGGIILMDYSFVRKSSCDYDVDRVVIDSTGRHVILESAFVKAKTNYVEDAPEKVLIPIKLPSNIALGAALYYPRVKYYCNWAQKLLNIPVVTVTPPTIFYVKPKT